MIDSADEEKFARGECRCADAASDKRALTDLFNQSCACLTLDREALHDALRREIGDPALADAMIAARPHLVSNVSAFVSRDDAEAMMLTARAVEAAARLPAYQDAALSTPLARRDFGPVGAFMGYDFHVTPSGPRLIEINTNAGGAWLAAFIARAQRACCPEIERALTRDADGDFESAVVAMFEAEWRRQRGAGRPRRIAIVDDGPSEQYLYPEFVLARRLFEQRGLDATIVDAGALSWREGGLSADGAAIDLVYNRLTDFALEKPEHAALREAYAAGAVVVTPSPRHHALLADKRNLVRLSDGPRLARWGLAEDHLAALKAVPRAVEVGAENAESLWAERRNYFFKPAAGHGSKAVYRGDKLTKGVWAEIARGAYVAQEIARPGERTIDIDEARRALKMDVRLYTYDGRLLLAAARLYQGQTTNFRTPGGGFAPVFLI